MTMQWFRLYNRIIDDKKIKLLAFEDRWHFVALCCLKSSGELDEPDDTLRARQVAIALGVQLSELDEIARRLRAVKLIDEGLNPVSWDELQFRSDVSTGRVREYRKRQKKQGGNKAKRQRNVSVTAQDTETDSETEKDRSCSSEHDCASCDARFDVSDFVESWNEVANACGLPLLHKLTDRRKRAFEVRRREYPDIEDWRAAFRTLRTTRWLHGENGNGWRADPDFFLQAKSFTKLVEGAYGKAH